MPGVRPHAVSLPYVPIGTAWQPARFPALRCAGERRAISVLSSLMLLRGAIFGTVHTSFVRLRLQ